MSFVRPVGMCFGICINIIPHHVALFISVGFVLLVYSLFLGVCAYKQICIDAHMILRKSKGKCKEITGNVVESGGCIVATST
jgi:hypothetical protein